MFLYLVEKGRNILTEQKCARSTTARYLGKQETEILAFAKQD